MKRQAPWDRPPPKAKRTKHLTTAEKSEAKTRAKRAGRHYPNLVDNLAVTNKRKRKKKKS
jgi:hypothetical protein